MATRATNHFWVIRVGEGRGIYRRRSDANQHRYDALERRGLANAFPTEAEAEEYLARPVPLLITPAGVVAWVRRQNPLLRLMVAAFVIQGALFVAFRAMVAGEKYLACEKNPIQYNQICVHMLKARVAVYEHQAKAIDIVAKEVIVLISIISYEIFGWLDHAN